MHTIQVTISTINMIELFEELLSQYNVARSTYKQISIDRFGEPNACYEHNPDDTEKYQSMHQALLAVNKQSNIVQQSNVHLLRDIESSLPWSDLSVEAIAFAQDARSKRQYPSACNFYCDYINYMIKKSNQQYRFDPRFDIDATIKCNALYPFLQSDTRILHECLTGLGDDHISEELTKDELNLRCAKLNYMLRSFDPSSVVYIHLTRTKCTNMHCNQSIIPYIEQAKTMYDNVE